MFVRYQSPNGSYSHKIGEAEFVASAEVQKDPSGNPIGVRRMARLRGMLTAENAAQLTQQIRALERAYSNINQFGRMELCHDDGTPTAHTLENCIVSMPPVYPSGMGAEYTTYRNYEIGLESYLPVIEMQPGQPQLLSAFENTRAKGGGPRFVTMELLDELPQRQLVQRYTKFIVIQSGQIRAMNYFGTPPPPRWPEYENVDERSILYNVQSGGQTNFQSSNSPYQTGGLGGMIGSFNQGQVYSVDWAYTFEFPQAFNVNQT
jgi:hypothetical protein